MPDFCVVALIIGGSVSAAVILLGLRDSRRAWKRRQELPDKERIALIREGAEFDVRQFERFLEAHAADGHPAAVWMRPTLDYCRRLQDLASAPHPSEEDALRLAEEVSRHEIVRKVKGVFLVERARELAELARRQETG